MEKVTKRTVLLISLVLMLAACVSVAKADNVRVIPVGGVHTGEPIVTTNPASINIFSTSHTPITNVWLTLIVDQDTYDHLVGIMADTTQFIKDEFVMPAESKIPPEAASGSYPGTEDQYNVATVKSKLSTSGNVYYAYKAFSINTITAAVQTFKLTVTAPGVTDLKVLVLANGYYAPLDNKANGKLNQSTPWSGSTFVIPEPATIALIVSSFGALGIFAVKRRKR